MALCRTPGSSLSSPRICLRASDNRRPPFSPQLANAAEAGTANRSASAARWQDLEMGRAMVLSCAVESAIVSSVWLGPAGLCTCATRSWLCWLMWACVLVFGRFPLNRGRFWSYGGQVGASWPDRAQKSKIRRKRAKCVIPFYSMALKYIKTDTIYEL